MEYRLLLRIWRCHAELNKCYLNVYSTGTSLNNPFRLSHPDPCIRLEQISRPLIGSEDGDGMQLFLSEQKLLFDSHGPRHSVLNKNFEISEMNLGIVLAWLILGSLASTTVDLDSPTFCK